MPSNSTSSDGTPDQNVYWHYTPSLPASIVFGFIFGCLALLHTYKLFRTRKWFCIPFVIGGYFEAIGYLTRAYCHSHLLSNPAFILQSIVTLLAPILFAGSIYMVLGRIIRGCNAAEYSAVRPSRLTKTFVAGDFTCFVLQALGGGALASAKTKKVYDTDNDIVLTGLVLQILFFCGFLYVAISFQRRLSRKETPEASRMPWKRLMYMLYGSSMLITIRNIYRVIEFAGGQNGVVLSHEWPLLVFDATGMVIVMTIGVWWYGSGLESVHHNRKNKMVSPLALEECRQPGENVGLNQKTEYHGNQPWS